jgi:cytochrome c-type biogenesis protein CcmF
MENVGALAILLAFCFAIYAVVASLVGKWAKRPLLNVSAERAVYCIWALLTTAVGLLLYGLFSGDFRLTHVYENSNLAMRPIYKITALWGGMEGSLLLWSWLLAGYAVVVAYQNRRKYRNMMPYVTAIIATVQTFFLSLNAFVESPFKVWFAGRRILDVTEISDGQGLNPLLQYWTMVIHPPILYLGFIGFIVPFAFAMSSLITKQPGEEWIHTTRRWTLAVWMLQTTGVLLGMNWAYSILGWGGYWGWDPVENASLLPWITATAFLHSVMMQEKKGMMKVWNMVLVSATFWLPIFGTTLTRTGMAQSVHAFGTNSPLGHYFYVFLGTGIAATVVLILSRLDYLKSETQLESVLSRESSFMFNNLVLLASCFAILWGTLFPVISEAISGTKVTVGKEFFNGINVPMALLLLLLTGIGPLIAWRKSSVESLKRAFLWPTIAGVGVGAILLIAGVRSFYGLISLMLCTFVIMTVAIEFFKGATAIRAKSGNNLLLSMVELTHRNTRRYGGYIVHIGVVIIFIGFTGQAFSTDKDAELSLGQSMTVGRYTLTAEKLESGANPNYRWTWLDLDVKKNGEDLGMLQPGRLFYIASNQQDTVAAIRHRLNEDLYVTFRTAEDDDQKVILKSYVNVLVSWVWIGYFVVLFGTIICLTPSKVKMIWPRTEVVGIAGKHAAVED